MLDKSLLLQKKNAPGFYLAFFSTLLALCVVVLGAYTRLTDAGLGCPDWPGCYGHLIVPSQTNLMHPIIDTTKAWTEMTHRYMAGLLGMMIFVLGILAIRNRHSPTQPVLLPSVLVVLVIFQALLGMWTVTLKLLPLVVIAHLLGGLTTLALLWWLTLKLKAVPIIKTENNTLKSFRTPAIIGLITLVIQIFLGGWTSANYAALVCLDFPHCQGKLLPELDILNAFNIFSAGVIGSTGTPLDNTARVTIHMMHRFGALVTIFVMSWLVLRLHLRARSTLLRLLSVLIAALLVVQIILGVTNVLAILPLPIAVAHHAVAALLLLALVSLNYYLYSLPRRPI